MSEGRIDNLAALMAAIVVVLKTGDLPQAMRPERQAMRPERMFARTRYPYGFFQYVANQLGVSRTYVGNVACGRSHSVRIAEAIERELETFVSPGRPQVERHIIEAVAQELQRPRGAIERVADGVTTSAPTMACLRRHGWTRPVPTRGCEPPCTAQDRSLINQTQLARDLGVSKSLMDGVIAGRKKSARVHTAIKAAVAAAKQKQVGA